MLEWNDQGSSRQARVSAAPPARSTFGRGSRRSADCTHSGALTPGRSYAHDLTPGRSSLSNRAVQRASARTKMFGSNQGRWTTEERGTDLVENDNDEVVVDIHVVHRQRLRCTPEVVEHLHKLHELQVHSLSWLEEDDRGAVGVSDGLDEADEERGAFSAHSFNSGGQISTCKLTQGSMHVTCELLPLLKSTNLPPALKPEGAPWPPPPSSLVSSADTLAGWLKLAVEARAATVEAEAAAEQQQFSQALATGLSAFYSHLTLRQQIQNLPTAVKLQVVTALMLIIVVRFRAHRLCQPLLSALCALPHWLTSSRHPMACLRLSGHRRVLPVDRRRRCTHDAALSRRLHLSCLPSALRPCILRVHFPQRRLDRKRIPHEHCHLRHTHASHTHC